MSKSLAQIFSSQIAPQFSRSTILNRFEYEVVRTIAEEEEDVDAIVTAPRKDASIAWDISFP